MLRGGSGRGLPASAHQDGNDREGRLVLHPLGIYRVGFSGGSKADDRDLAVGLVLIFPVAWRDGGDPGQSGLALFALEQRRSDSELAVSYLEPHVLRILGQVDEPRGMG